MMDPSRKSKVFFLLSFILLISVNVANGQDTCSSDNDCGFLQACKSNVCNHKDMFPLTLPEVLLTILQIVIFSFTTIGGSGAGSATTALLVLIWNFTVNQALSLSYSLVFAAILANCPINIPMKDEETGTSLIRYDVAFIMIPAVLFGTLIGLNLNRYFPDIAILAFLVVILIPVLGRALMRAIAKWKLEKAAKAAGLPAPAEDKNIIKKIEDVAIEALRGSIELNDDPVKTKEVAKETAPEKPPNAVMNELASEEIVLQNKVNENEQESNNTDKSSNPEQAVSNPDNDIDKLEQEKFLRKEKSLIPFELVIPLGLLLVVVIFLNLVSGTPKINSIFGISFCGSGYWGFQGLQLLVCAAFFVAAVYLTLREHRLKKHCKYTSLVSYTLDTAKIRTIGIWSIIAGVVLGFSSAATGYMMTSVLLDVGLKPQSVSKTILFSEMFSVLTTTVISLLSGAITTSQIEWFLPVIFAGVLVGAGTLNHFLIKKYKRNSLLVFIVFICGSSVLFLVPAYVLMNTFRSSNPSTLYKFKDICARSH